MSADHHTSYLAKTVSALTPEGRRRVETLLCELVQASGDHEWVARFARERTAEVETGRVEAATPGDPTLRLSVEELDRVTAGFMTIRDEEPLDDVADWANAVVELITDERDRGITG